MKRQYSYFYLSLFALSLLLTVTLQLSPVNRHFGLGKEYIHYLAEQINGQIHQLAEDRDAFIDAFQHAGKDRFKLSAEDSGTQYFVFRNNELVFWSDYRFVPTYESIKGNYHYKFFNSHHGQFIISRTRFEMPEDTLQLFALLPVYQKYKVENAYLKSGYNPALIDDPSVQISLEKAPSRTAIYSPHKEYLFSLDYNVSGERSQQFKRRGIWLLILSSFLSLGLYVYTLIRGLEQGKRYEVGLLIWLAYFIAVRAIMLSYHFPFSVFEWDLFNPKLYASSFISPSVGDLLINLGIIGFIIYYILRKYARSRTHLAIRRLSPVGKNLALGYLVVLSHLTMQGFYYVLTTIFLHSKLNLDITRNIDFSTVSLNGISIFIFASLIFFFASHLFSRLSIQLSPQRDSRSWLIFLMASLLYFVVAYIFQFLYEGVFLIQLLYFFVLHFSRLPKRLHHFKYISFIYLFTGALVCATVGTYAIYSYGKKKSTNEKRKFANRLLPETDEFAEYLLEKAITDIQSDPLIVRSFTDPSFSTKLARQKSENHT
ncbi:MAG: hypothetical protein HC880_06745 [Bacteroidia bacterium]|nr:hypothetical protein [Bacteroidia bacterium]